MTDSQKPPQVSLSCPNCGEKLTHVWTNDRIEVYHCSNNGVVVLPPGGPMRVVIH